MFSLVVTIKKDVMMSRVSVDPFCSMAILNSCPSLCIESLFYVRIESMSLTSSLKFKVENRS